MLKKCGRSFASLLLVFLLVASVFTVSGSAAWIWGKKSTTKKLNFSNGKSVSFKEVYSEYDNYIDEEYPEDSMVYADITVHDDDEKSIDITTRTYSQSSLEVKFKAEVPDGYIMRFNYSVDDGSAVPTTRSLVFASADGSTMTSTLEDGTFFVTGSKSGSTLNLATFKFVTTVEANDVVGDEGKVYSAHMTDIVLEPVMHKNVTVKAPASGGSVKAGDVTVNAGGSDTVIQNVGNDTGLKLTPVPASGYVFAGYKFNNSSLVTNPSAFEYTYFPDNSDNTIEAVFVPTNAPSILVGNTSGYQIVSDLRTAISTASTNGYHYIMPITDITVADDGQGAYNIPSGVTLVIPNDSDRVVYRELPNILYSAGSGYFTKNPKRSSTLTKNSPATPYVTMTVNENVIINVASGAEVSVGGIQYSPNGGGEASVKGGYGLVIMKEGAKMNFANGSYLYAWGFIISDPPATATSEPSIVCASGAVVYEMFQITDYSGGSIISDIVPASGGCIFPFSQYYVQNVEAKMKLNAGAEERVCGALTVSGNAVATSLTFIGTGSAMFSLSSGCAIKYYDYEADKLICRLDEGANAAINSMSLNVGIDLDTANFQLPISNIGVEIAGNSTVEINQDLQLFPDSYVTLDEGSSLTLKANVYVADTATIDGHVMGSKSVKPMVFSATRYAETGNGKSLRTKDTLSEPYIINDGAVTINAVKRNNKYVGSLNLVGEGGSITGTGTITNNAVGKVNPPDIKLIDFYYDANKGRQAGQLEPEPGETETQCADSEANGEPYSYDADREIWHPAEVTVTFYDPDGEFDDIENTVAYATLITAPTQTKDGFALRWVNDDDEDEIYAPGAQFEALRYTDYYAEWTELPPEPGEVSHSLSLEGQIHVNFYWTLVANEDPADYTCTFTFMGKTTDPQALPTDPDPVYGYKTSIAVNAPEMTSDIDATLYKGDVVVKTDTFKAADYAAAYNEYYQEYDTELLDNTPYLIGKINGSADWSKANPRYKFTDNPNNADEYILSNVPLTAGDEIKVVKYYTGTQSYGWYPDGDNNNYVVNQNGVYNIYFKKNSDGFVDGWHHGKFYVETVSTDNKVYQATLLPTLLQATMNYGSKAQTFFNVNADDLADDHISHKGVYGEVTQDMINNRLGDAVTRDRFDNNIFADYGLEYYGASLVMNANTKIKLYFGVKDATVFNAYRDTFTFNGTHVDAVSANSAGDLVSFTLDGIAPANLHVRYELANTNGTTKLTYAALDYLTTCMDLKDEADGSKDKALYNLTQALYWYNVYADAYFKGAV